MAAKWWKNPYIAGTTIHWFLIGLKKTLRISVQKHVEIDPNKPYIFAFWHGTQLLPSFVLTKHHFTELCALVSPSSDGDIITVHLQKSGFKVVRGSSRAQKAQALIRMKQKIAQGASVGSSFDGPLGPRHVVKPGVIFLAQKCNMQIIPLGCAYSRSWVFEKAWDKFQIPKPFSKSALVLGQPYTVPLDMPVESGCLLVADLIRKSEQQAMDLIK